MIIKHGLNVGCVTMPPYLSKSAMMALDRLPELRLAVKVMASMALGVRIKVFLFWQWTSDSGV